MTAALKASPERADKINAASAAFDQAEADARPVRAAALAGNNVKASNLMRGGVSQKLQQGRAGHDRAHRGSPKVYRPAFR